MIRELLHEGHPKPIIDSNLNEICELAVRSVDEHTFPESTQSVIKELAEHLCREYDVRNSRNKNKPLKPESLEKKLYKIAQEQEELRGLYDS